MSSFVRKKISFALPTDEDGEDRTGDLVVSSFSERIQRTVPSGTHVNTQGTLLVSTGIASLDALLNDGLPVGRLVFILEDDPRSSSNYANTILKCFLAEGIVSGNKTVLMGEEGNKILAGLPGTSTRSDQQVLGLSKPSDDKMTIAWRYKHIQSVESGAPAPKFGNNFDLGKKLDVSQYENRTVLIDDIDKSLETIRHELASMEDRKQIMRIAIRSLGSPLFTKDDLKELWRWMHEFHRIVRDNQIVLMATIPSYLDESLLSLGQYADCIIQVKASTAYPEYQGFIRIVRPLRIPDSFALSLPETSNLAFKCKQRRFIIEKFHLPPEQEAEASAGCAVPNF